MQMDIDERLLGSMNGSSWALAREREMIICLAFVTPSVNFAVLFAGGGFWVHM